MSRFPYVYVGNNQSVAQTVLAVTYFINFCGYE